MRWNANPKMISRAMMKIGAACVLMSKVYSDTFTGEQEKSIFSTKGSESEAVKDVERTESDDKYGIAQAEEAATFSVENPSSVEEGSESEAVQDVERTESDDKYGIAQAEEEATSEEATSNVENPSSVEEGSESEAVQDVERTESDDKYGIAQAEEEATSEEATSNVENPSSVEEGSESEAVKDVERTESDDKYGIAQAEEAENSNKDATALPHSAPLSNADGKPQAMKRVANGNKVLSAEEIKKRDEEFLKNFARVKDISEKI